MTTKNIFMKTRLAVLCILVSFFHYSIASNWVGDPSGKTSDIKKLAAGCANPATSTYMDFNNARVLIHTGGDMWWDLQDNPRYEIPKGGGAHSLFSGSLWLGGTDVNGQLRIAAQRYRGPGVDFWTGPLTEGTASITSDECEKWDKHFVVSRKMVDEFRAWFLDPASYPNYTIPSVIIDWPAHGDVSKGEAYYLAPFYDNDGDGTYDAYKGDYPYYDMDPRSECNRSRDRVPKLYGDYTLWWIFNDKGNVHMETQADAIGMEIHAQAFAFATQDEINNMTFYNYILINRSTYKLINTYFGTNFDVDIGCAWDDYVGCDVRRGLGYAYNGDAVDGAPCTTAPPGDYGDKTPAVGIDFFEGPYQDPDGEDNPRYLTINPVIFQGSGLNDLIPGGTYTGNADVTYAIKISNNSGLRDSFQWRKATGSCSDTGVCVWLTPWSGDSVVRGKEGGNLYPTAQELIDGITVSFNSNKNHTVGDVWLVPVIVKSSNNARCDASINGLNFGDGVVDNERWGMRRFLYYVNCQSGPTCDPENGLDYYRLLQGIWKDGKKMVYGADGHTCTSPWPCIPTDFMFPGNPTTDPCGWGQAEGNGGVPVDLSQNPNGGWNEVTAGNTSGDRRFVHSAGPFVLDPGAENDITTGVVWMRSDDGNPLSSVELVRIADDKAQALFDNCFKLLNGPDAPCLSLQELDRELILYLTNPKTSNNYLEQYDEIDPTITDSGLTGILGDTAMVPYDKHYRFEGYLLYQVKDSTVSVDELDNVERSRPVRQVDVKNGITKIINYAFDDDMGIEVPALMVNGEDKGILHTFKVTDDLFATGSDKKLVNFKKYYFVAIAYSYNNFNTYSPQTGDIIGQHKPFLRGRKNCVGGSIVPTVGIPHKSTPEAGGSEPMAKYGDSPGITRNEGIGNGSVAVSLSQATELEILNNGKASQLVYEQGKAPVDVKIVDPLNVKAGTFTLKFSEYKKSAFNLSKVKLAVFTVPVGGTNYFEVMEDITDTFARGDKIFVSGSTYFDGSYTVYKISGKQIFTCEHIPCRDILPCSGIVSASGTIRRKFEWVLLDSSNDTAATSERTIDVQNEQLIPDLGISITIGQTVDPGPVTAYVNSATTAGGQKMGGQNPDPVNNGFISGEMIFSDNTKQWLTFFTDGEGANAENWIRSGSRTDPNTPKYDDYFVDGRTLDTLEKYEKVLSGLWAPYALASRDTLGPALGYTHKDKNVLSRVMSVDLVITSDDSKWTRAVVLEMEDDSNYAEGKKPKFAIRSDYSIDKNGNASTTSAGSSTITDPNYISGRGMGWFPGYAINVETGERLNIVYGENSRLKTDLHGDDMVWNPSPDVSSPTGMLAWQGGFCQLGADQGCPFWVGGMHFIYVVGNDIDGSGYGSAYDGGEWIYNTLQGKKPSINAIDFYKVLKDFMWVGIPLLEPEYNFSDPHQIPTDVRIKLRMTKAYTKYASGQTITVDTPNTGTLETGKYYYVANGYALHNGMYYQKGSVFKAENSTLKVGWRIDSLDKKLASVTVILTQNEGNPLFSFSLDGFVPRINDGTLAKEALDMIGVVPNPYYGMSGYETGPLDNRVKIINLPKRCVVSIYNVNGTLIRQYDRDNSGNTFLDWDLKNYKGVPISSGVYVIHVSVPDVGEKTLKWFGVLRPVDLESF